jgi:membrane fusion protein, heavy metal efflux system
MSTLMDARRPVRVACVIVAIGVGLGMLGRLPHVGAESAKHDAAEAEPAKGPHGGRLLRDGGFAVEVTIFERGVPPEFRVYCYDGETPTDCAGVGLTIELARFGPRTDTIRFAKSEGYLRGDRTVEEPHSFDVTVVAEEGGHTHRWTYPSPEGRTELSPEAVRSSGLGIETAGPASIVTKLQAYGRVTANEDRLANVTPRFPGVVKEIRKRLGDRVEPNEVLATIESNESLQRYDVRSAIAGTVIRKDVRPGELAREDDVLYTVADLGTVWVDLSIRAEDQPRLRVGQPVSVEIGLGGARVEGKLGYLSPVGAPGSQTSLARVELPNPDGALRPGLFATAEIVVDEATVPIAVRASALQTFRDWDVVFLTDGHVFQAIPIEIGRRDHEWIEVVQGVAAGQRYVAENSFIVKADIGKSGAVHEH